MNLIATIMCLISTATAAALSGYNYNQPRNAAKQNSHPQATVTNNGIYSAQQAPPLPAFNIPLQHQAQQIKQNLVAAPAAAPALQYAPLPPEITAPSRQYTHQQQQQQVIVPSQAHNQATPQFAAQVPPYIAPAQQPAVYAPTFAGAASGSAQYQHNQQSHQPQQQTIISKDIYIHSAPEETEEINSYQELEGGPLRKNYRIVFIKAPTQNVRFNTESIKRTQAANEEKTVIYVLSKKPDITSIHNQLTSIQTQQKSNKPEVYFIKYKTPEEAARAQQEIQAQYDALGGSTRISDEGIAPITSVIGGGAVNAGTADNILASGSASGSSFSGSSNFVQTPPANQQQQFVQSSFQGSQASASSTSFAIQAPGLKYLPVKNK